VGIEIYSPSIDGFAAPRVYAKRSDTRRPFQPFVMSISRQPPSGARVEWDGQETSGARCDSMGFGVTLSMQGSL